MLLVTLGVFGTLTIVLLVAIWAIWTRDKSIAQDFRKILEILYEIRTFIQEIPAPVQNVICFDLKGPRVDGKLMPVNIVLKPEDFSVSPEQLLEKLLDQAKKSKNVTSVESRAYMILNHAGVDAIIGSENRREIGTVLQRLLINDDDQAIAAFLKTTAESICKPVSIAA